MVTIRAYSFAWNETIVWPVLQNISAISILYIILRFREWLFVIWPFHVRQYIRKETHFYFLILRDCLKCSGRNIVSILATFHSKLHIASSSINVIVQFRSLESYLKNELKVRKITHELSLARLETWWFFIKMFKYIQLFIIT